MVQMPERLSTTYLRMVNPPIGAACIVADAVNALMEVILLQNERITRLEERISPAVVAANQAPQPNGKKEKPE